MHTDRYTAFAHFSRIASGDLLTVLTASKDFVDADPAASGGHAEALLIFSHASGRQFDFDLRGSIEEVLARLPSDLLGAAAASGAAPSAVPRAAAAASSVASARKAGRGRPSLGVSPGEVTLLPRHWDWLAAQPAKASGTIRRLVDEERTREKTDPKKRAAILGTLLWSLAGNVEGFEEASRCLYRQDLEGLFGYSDSWPGDLGPFVREWFAGNEGPANSSPAPAHETISTTGSFQGLRLLDTGTRIVRSDRSAAGPELWRLGAAELAIRIRQGLTSAEAVMDAFLRRIEEVGKCSNAIVEVWADEARAAAEAVDRGLHGGAKLGPLAGLPFTVKANLDVAGKATSHGIPAMKGAIAPLDAPLVARFRAAGAIPVGHSNLPDLSLRFHTDSSLYGATMNPWNAAMSPGGSSGGEGAAIGSGQSPLGLGNDAGGSLRIPALFGGVAALKPSAGRFPSDRSVGPRDSTLATQLIPVDGILARSVADLHLAYQVLSGPDPRDPRAVPAPLWGPALARPIKVALALDPGAKGVHPEVVIALEAAAAVLSRNGYEVERVDPPRFDETVDAYGRMIMTEFEQSRSLFERIMGADGRRYISFSTELRKPVDLEGYLALCALRQGLVRDWALFMANYPLLLCPVFLDPASKEGDDIASLESHRRMTDAMAVCSATSFIGLPAVAVPTGLSAGTDPAFPAGLPLGAQLVSSFFREDLCLEAAAAIERGLGRLGPVDPR